MASPLRFLPLGGLGEIGMNCMAVEHDGQRFLIDCGVTFDDRGLGVDVVHADFTALRSGPELTAVVLTHGHEDHIGALPYLLQEFPVPVYGPPYALELVKERLEDRQRTAPIDSPELHPIAPGDRVRFGEIEVEPYRVTHSIPDATGLILRTPHGVVVHSGDFKIDPDPTDGEPLDLERLDRLRRDEGVRLLFSDSTNALVPGSSGPERMVQDHLEQLVRDAPGRVVVSIFSSNVHRIRALALVASRTGRRLCLLGRSLETHARISERLGHLKGLEGVRIPRDQASDLPPDKLLVAATGTQGEPPAALARIAEDTHPDLSLAAGDRVIHSARIIPGNDRSVFDLLNALERRGIEVIARHLDPKVHVSGHAYREEQRTLLSTLQPESFVPIHGTFVHLRQHAALAKEVDVHDVHLVQNGDVVQVDEGGVRIEGSIPTGRILRDGGEELADVVLRDRRLLANYGVAIVSVVVDDAGRPAGDVDVLTRGVIHEDTSQELLDDACEAVYKALRTARHVAERPADQDLEAEARRALKRFFVRRVGKRPLCYALVLRASA